MGGEALVVRIEKMIWGGAGLGRLPNGMVVQVPAALPGELVRISGLVARKRYATAMVDGVIEPSPDRVTPPCPYLPRCGGCDFQHMAFEVQAKMKAAAFADQLQRFLPGHSALIEQADFAIPAEAPFHYRQRIQLKAGQDGSVGFHAARSNALVPITACLLARPELNEALAWLHGQEGFRRAVTLSGGVDLQSGLDAGGVHVVFPSAPQGGRGLEAAVAALDGAGPAGLFFWLETGQGRPRLLSPEVSGPEARAPGIAYRLPDPAGGPDLALSLPVGSFCQVNQAQNIRLVGLVCRWLKGCGVRHLLDLHCGMGNFALPLARIVDQVSGSDIAEGSIGAAQANARTNGIDNAAFHRRPAGAMAAKALRTGQGIDAVLLDPPRQGAAEAVPAIVALRPRHVVCISCDAATLLRDLKALLAAGYQLRRLNLIDLFPQTHHAEFAAHLMRD